MNDPGDFLFEILFYFFVLFSVFRFISIFWSTENTDVKDKGSRDGSIWFLEWERSHWNHIVFDYPRPPQLLRLLPPLPLLPLIPPPNWKPTSRWSQSNDRLSSDGIQSAVIKSDNDIKRSQHTQQVERRERRKTRKKERNTERERERERKKSCIIRRWKLLDVVFIEYFIHGCTISENLTS